MTTASTSTDWIGRHIGHQQRYRIENLLGSGGMGTVFLAKDTLLGKQVALKVLKAALSEEDAFRQRFEREVSVCAALASEHIVRIDDYGITDEGYPYFVMERLMGETLAQRLSFQGQLSIDASISIVNQICTGLKTAHQGVSLWVKGEATAPIKIIHRDLKPENIFLVPTGLGDLVKILDFGIAKISDEQKSDQGSGLTGTDMFIGTFDYASPEQVSGSRKLDERSDIYSLGMILYRMLSGTDPFGLGRSGQRTSGINWAVAHATKSPESLREQSGCEVLPPALEAIVMRCIAKAPEDRYLSVDELRRALLSFAASRNPSESHGGMSQSAATVVRDLPLSPPSAPASIPPVSQPQISQPQATSLEIPSLLPPPPTVIPLANESPLPEPEFIPALGSTSLEIPALISPEQVNPVPGVADIPASGGTSVETPALSRANQGLASPIAQPMVAPPTQLSHSSSGTVISPSATGETQVVAPLSSPPSVTPPAAPKAISIPAQPAPPRTPQSPSKPFPLALVGGGVALLLAVTGAGSFMLLQSQNANQKVEALRDLKAKSEFDQCIAQATDIAGSSAAVMEVLSQCRVGSGQALASKSKLVEAIAAVTPIPESDPSFSQAKTLLNKWADQLIEQATQQYNSKGETDAAVALLQKIPDSSAASAQAKKLVTQWQQETQENRQALKLAQAALAAGSWQSAIDQANQVETTTPYWREQKQQITSKAQTKLDEIAYQRQQELRRQREQEQRQAAPPPQQTQSGGADPPPRRSGPEPPPRRTANPPPRNEPAPPPANGDLCQGESLMCGQ